MAKTVVMPQMGYDMDAGTLLRWLKQEGDAVERGEAIAEIETDKVNIEIEAFEGGVLRKTLITEGQTVPVGEPIAIIGTADEPIEGDTKAAPAAPSGESTGVPLSAEAGQPKTAEAGSHGSAESPVQAAQQGAGQGEQPLQLQDQMETGVAAPVPAHADGGAGMAATASSQGTGERIRASPLVRRIAAEHDIDLSQVTGTGPHGRIVKRDIEGLMTGARPQPQPQPVEQVQPQPEARPEPVAAPEPEPVAARGPQPVSAGGELRDLSRIRQTIGKRMSQSFQQAPHFYVTMAIDMTKAMELRAQINAELGNDRAREVTINDLIIKASALTLREFPVLNAAWEDGKMRLHDTIDIGNAVALEGGLISPFIPEADTKSLGEISRMMKDLAKRAREGGLKPEEYQGGTFTISNIGMYGVEDFIAIINPPQAAILAVGTVKMEPVWNAETSEFEPRQMMKVTMSADHRLTDGAEVARYLQALKARLESPMLLLVG
jgi:pyruvate dehydrogenase E2 component (dihydrolipoamide acetyltransferase)